MSWLGSGEEGGGRVPQAQGRAPRGQQEGGGRESRGRWRWEPGPQWIGSKTGRAGKKGLAISLTTDRDEARLEAIQKLTGTRIESVKRRAGKGPGLKRLLESIARAPRMMTVLISGGRKDKVRPGDILGALTGEAGGLKSADIGKIEIQDRLSYVAVTRGVARHAVQQLNRGRIKGRRFRATLIDTFG